MKIIFSLVYILYNFTLLATKLCRFQNISNKEYTYSYSKKYLVNPTKIFEKLHGEAFCIAKYVLFYNDNSNKYKESRENRGAMVIISSGLEIFRGQSTKDSKNELKL